ncbi:ABC transporter substrate-binding protein [Brevibacterium sp. 50QC2O2]|jgi:peptide/nickel transport system substrate-binding protein|uniref:ABC transporter substrate-binding protein n=1 Tax=unclassified Brevibacterium TaxID=2614124 RepID=UPI00211C3865|nr:MULTISPECIES: ABC transporter substrate-binding protein [unclassified Brevibacterium]MCQ9368768.1 ABC transporter substrate-binding protein [Brevibacterium sp. 91QC2O2]MCQ9389750.1 ABC transporter substrate-binding protein [Brevibacterium sp. 50QC2O2]
MKHFITTVIASLCILALAGCSSTAAQDRAQELVVAIDGDISSFDPVMGNSGNDHTMLYPVYDTLFDFDPKTLEPKPGLVDKWDYPSAKKLVMHLRSGVKFHDGTTLDATAVKANLERVRSKGSNLQAELAAVDDIKVVDPSTIELDLKTADTSLPLLLSDRSGMMVSPKAIEAGVAKLKTNPVGTGPWKLTSWQRGTAIKYTAFDDYWNKSVKVEPRLTIRIFTDPKTRVDALTTSQVDMALAVGPADAGNLELNSRITVHPDNSIRVRMVYLDMSSEDTFAQKKLRQAVNLAIDREQMAKVGFFGYAQPAYTYLPASHWASVEDDVPHKVDPEKARALVREVGAEGKKFSILLPNDSNSVRVGEIIRASLGDIGLQVDMEPREVVQSTTEYFDELRQPGLLSAWTGRPDPGQMYRQLLGTTGYYNAGHGVTPGLDDLVTKANAQKDQDARGALLKKAGMAAFENASQLPLVFEDRITAVNQGVEGYQSNLLGKPKFVGITKSR